MNLLTIQEPNTPSKKKICLGIDFGTTNSVVSVVIDNKIEFIKDENNKILIPTLIHYDDDIKIFGNNIKYPKNITSISSIKRNFLSKPEEKIFINEKKVKINSTEVASDFFNYLKTLCDKKIKSEVYDCILTVPAYYDEKSRSEIMRSALMAGLNVKRLINEPTSAAFAYGLEKKKTGTFIVYDLGGGTFDISILKLADGIFKVLGTSGNPKLGGDDFDILYAKFLIKQNFDLDFNLIDLKEKKNVIYLCKSIKEKFNTEEFFTKKITIKNQTKNIKFKLNDFNKCINDLVNETVSISEKLCDELKITDKMVDGIILVGGSTRCNLVLKKLNEKFNTKIYNDTDPDLVVSKGASFHGNDILNGSSNLLLDVTPLSLGIETMGGLMEKVISRNTPIPSIKEQTFTTYENGQTSIKIKVLQGERETSKNNTLLGEFILSGLKPKPAGIPRVTVRFSVDADGILVITAIDDSSGIKEDLVIKTNNNIGIKDLRKIVESSINNAEQDVNYRLLIETKIKAKKLINEIKYFKKDIERLCSKKNIESINKFIKMLKNELSKNNKERIEEIYSELNKETEKFAEKKIDDEFKSIVGQSTEDIAEK